MATYAAAYANSGSNRQVFGSDALLIKTTNPESPGTVVAVFSDIASAQTVADALNGGAS